MHDLLFEISHMLLRFTRTGVNYDGKFNISLGFKISIYFQAHFLIKRLLYFKIEINYLR